MQSCSSTVVCNGRVRNAGDDFGDGSDDGVHILTATAKRVGAMVCGVAAGDYVAWESVAALLVPYTAATTTRRDMTISCIK